MTFYLDFNAGTEAEKKNLYLRYMKPVIYTEALFADETSDYVEYTDKKVRLRFRTGKRNVEQVFIYIDGEKLRMQKEESTRIFDYYRIDVDRPSEQINYYFEVHSGKMCICYNKLGASHSHDPEYDFKWIPGFRTPDWAKGAVFYQIFTDRFCNGDPSNDVENREYMYIQSPSVKVEDWNALPQAMDVERFYGGDLQGILDQLDYLQDLGVEVIYLNPIFVSPSNHKYDIQDYDYVDPHYGKILYDGGECLSEGETTNEHATKYRARVTDRRNLEAGNALFAELTSEIHRRGMKIILDGVFNHCGSFNKWMDREHIYDKDTSYAKGAFVCSDSPYRNFFRFHSENWPDNKDYDGWWGHDTLPKLNYEGSEELCKYILGIAKKWLSPPYNIDGWRLDVAADLGMTPEFNHKFWKAFRKEVKTINPDALILAEHYGNPEAWLRGDEWDTVMNYDAFMEPVTWLLTGMEKHSDDYRGDLFANSEAFRNAMTDHMSAFQGESLYTAMNELSNHDHSRFLTRTNHRVGRLASAGSAAAGENLNFGIFRAGVLLQMTWPGAPTIYYGDEAGVCGWTDPDNRRTYPWGHENKDLIAFHKEIIRIHKENRVLQTGSFDFLMTEGKGLAYGRFNRKDQMVVVLNMDSKKREYNVPVWQLDIGSDEQMIRMIRTTEMGFDTEEVCYAVEKGCIHVMMEPYSGMILQAGIQYKV